MDPLVLNALILIMGTLAGVAAGVLPFRKWGEGLVDLGLGFTGGVMLVASFTSLILPAVERWGFWQVGLGIAGGVAFIRLLDVLLPHEHLVKGYEGPAVLAGKLKKSWLIALAITIHNIPEGLAVGVATIYNAELGFVTALAIAIQDVPEGAAVVMPLLKFRLLKTAVLIGVISAVVEGGAALASALFLSAVPLAMGAAMGLAGGAMMYVTAAELYPDIYAEDKRKDLPTYGFVAGVLTMLYLDVAMSS